MEFHWWQTGIVYQIYPRSFADSDGDGIGDLRGIAEKLDYLEWLGIDAIWISPIFPSPMVDFGYDVSDYCDIHPIFGSMEDFDRLIDAVHARGMRVILDFVPNHTSDRHRWFMESRSSRHNPKRDWYIWRDPATDGGPPNNWLAVFGGSAWTYDEGTGQYYYHAFFEEQPDLNWRNAEVREAMYEVLRFWMDKGVDGFRVDVLWHLSKDAEFRDNPPNPDYFEGKLPYYSLLPVFSANQPEIHGIVSEMRRVVNEYDERVIIGEIYLPLQELVAYYGEKGSGIHLPFNFQLVELPWDARMIGRAITEYEALLPEEGWPNWVLGNHDKPRIATRVGPAQARVAAMLLLTLRGTPTLYYGDEIGMHDVPIPLECVQDPKQKNLPALNKGRDPVRTPMQWTDTPGAGFTSGKPWLPLADDYRDRNVMRQREDSASMLALYRRLIALRRSEEALSVGAYVPVESEGDILAYERRFGGSAFLVALNMRSSYAELELAGRSGQVALSTMLDRAEPVSEALALRPDEGVIVRLR